MRKALKWIGIVIGGLVGICLIIGVTLALIGRSRLNGRYEVAATLPPAAVASASIADGERIAMSRGCTECHGDGLSGRIFLDIPPGLAVASNLTRGKGGVGNRYASPDDWNRAVRYGVRPDHSVLVPFMPSDFFNRLSDLDAASVALYLANLPAVDNELPASKMRVPGYIMMGTPGMSIEKRIAKMLEPRVTPQPGPTAEYGRYIASTTCVGCHGENMLGGPHHNPEGLRAPALWHVGMWSRDQFATAVRTGVVPGGRQLTDWMPSKMFAVFTDDEMTALYEFVKTIRPAASPTQGAQQ